MKEMLCGWVGEVLFRLGFKPGYSTGIHGGLTVGYGELDPNGFWRFPSRTAVQRSKTWTE